MWSILAVMALNTLCDQPAAQQLSSWTYRHVGYGPSCLWTSVAAELVNRPAIPVDDVHRRIACGRSVTSLTS